MKKQFNVLILSMLLMGAYACTESKTTPDAKDVAASKPAGATVAAMLPDEIADTTANREMAAWRTKRRELINLLIANRKAADSIYLSRGYAVPTQDFKDVASIARGVGQDTITYAMIALRNGVQTTIFQIKDSSGKERYFDFANPCPLECPPGK